MLNPKPIELGGQRTLDVIIDELSRAIHELMLLDNPSKKVLDEIDELTMQRNRYSRRLAEVEAKKADAAKYRYDY